MPANPLKVAQGEMLRDSIIEFVRDYTAERGEAPEQRDIAAALGVTPKTIQNHMPRLRAEGRIKTDGRGRNIRVVEGKG